MSLNSAERITVEASDNFVFQRSLLAYHTAAQLVRGTVLEIGTGSGYGVEVISPRADHFVTIDKFDSGRNFAAFKNVEFHKMMVPPLDGVRNSSVDFVISFQVIEHIQHDKEFVAEVYRVLKPGGTFIVTTPNRGMSLTRNPWHVREYAPDELRTLLRSYFADVECNGVFGNTKVMEYYAANRRSVENITRYDVLDLQHRLPRQLLQLPYDILNRINRRRLLKSNTQLTTGITMNDYFISKADDGCFDLMYYAHRGE